MSNTYFTQEIRQERNWSMPAASSKESPAPWLFRTTDDWAPLLARLTLGLVMFPHGAQKALGWFGGEGFSGTMNFFTGQMHIPALFAFLAIAVEFAGALGLITGTLARISALGIAVNMIVAIFTVHAANGFFMNWFGNQKGEGFEYHILAIGLALIVSVRGAGKWSVDRLVARKFIPASRRPKTVMVPSL